MPKGLEGTDVQVCTVMSFPLGSNNSLLNKKNIQNGADEVDMVINVGALKSGDLVVGRYSCR